MSKNNKDMNIYKASDYWDDHDFEETGDFKKVHDVKFLLKREKYVGIDDALYQRIKNKAQQVNKSEEALIHDWLSKMVGV